MSAGAYFFLAGEALAGFDPLGPADAVDWEVAGRAARAADLRSFQRSTGSSSHWWLEREHGSPKEAIIDLNIGPEDQPDQYDYDGTSRAFFMTTYKRPTMRALEVIKRVKEARKAASSAQA